MSMVKSGFDIRNTHTGIPLRSLLLPLNQLLPHLEEFRWSRHPNLGAVIAVVVVVVTAVEGDDR